jgi:hypothetical protein
LDEQVVTVTIGPDSIRNYRRLAYEYWYAMAEFIDNSTQSYFNNKQVLDAAFVAEGEGLRIDIVYERDDDLLRITDNSIGMDEAELEAALQIAKPPKDRSGRSEYGMGLKTAATWLGDVWTVRTKKLGEEYEYLATFDVEKVANGALNLPVKRSKKAADKHYTVIEVRQMHSKIAGRTVGKIKDYLRSMYRVDTRDGVLDLRWMGTKLLYAEDSDFLKAADGSPYRKDFDLVVGGKRVNGWVGILLSGSRAKAGFSILRRGRLIRGHPDAWRPRTIFGQDQGSNNLVNQRLVGEVNLDQFGASHTKSNILWRGNEEEDVEKALQKVVIDYVKVAQEYRKKAGQTGPTTVQVQAAVDELKEEMSSAAFNEILEIEDVPPPALAAAAVKPVLNAVVGEEPNFVIEVGASRCRIFLSFDASPNDPYFASDSTEDDLLVVVNAQHPHFSTLVGASDVLNYLRHCVYDAVAEWQCRRKTGHIEADTIKILKDRLLRLELNIEEGPVSDTAA